jgi:hypothetical protein
MHHGFGNGIRLLFVLVTHLAYFKLGLDYQRTPHTTTAVAFAPAVRAHYALQVQVSLHLPNVLDRNLTLCPVHALQRLCLRIDRPAHKKHGRVKSQTGLTAALPLRPCWNPLQPNLRPYTAARRGRRPHARFARRVPGLRLARYPLVFAFFGLRLCPRLGFVHTYPPRSSADQTAFMARVNPLFIEIGLSSHRTKPKRVSPLHQRITRS